MASMTTWTARRAKRGDGDRFLCGRLVAGRHVCPEMIARLALDQPSSEIWLPVGLTDDGSPGAFRWSSYAAARIARGEGELGRGKALIRAGQAPERVHTVTMEGQTVTVPCRKGHQNNLTWPEPSV